MREIKFRTWHKQTNEMSTVMGLAVSDLSERFDLVDDSTLGELVVSDWDDLDNRVLMQYTGLKDKNGKEIYEGDIGESENAIYLIQWNTERAQYQAKIIKTKSILTKHCSFPLWQYVEDEGSCRFEIIGNIYENPEQMEK